MNPYDELTVIRDYKKAKAVPWPMASFSGTLTKAFGINGYPAFVLVDRNGVIQKVTMGARLELEPLMEELAPYLGDDYQPQ